ncbi:MAG: hypothetical protein ABIR58_05805 [Gemmatimonadaceae bacterium]
MNDLLRSALIAAKPGALVALFSGCLSLSTVDPSIDIDELPAGGHHVLFIGNSLTYTNDLPGTVAEMARSVGDTVRVRSVSFPNLAVIDHALGQSNAVAVIRSQPWEYVVLQQGPTTVGLNRDTLIIATKLLDPHVRQSGGRTAQFMTWPRSDRTDLFDAVRQTSQVAAESVKGVFIPAGEAWNAALTANPQIALYGPDGYHPGPLGTYLAALVIFERVTGRDARSLPATARVAGVQLIVPENTVRFLQQVAHETVARFPESQPLTSTAVAR